MAKDFEAYAEREYLGAVCRTDEDADLQLAGVRYVATCDGSVGTNLLVQERGEGPPSGSVGV